MVAFLTKSWRGQNTVHEFNKERSLNPEQKESCLSPKTPSHSWSLSYFNRSERGVWGRTSDFAECWLSGCHHLTVTGERFCSLRHRGHYSVHHPWDVSTRHKNQLPASCWVDNLLLFWLKVNFPPKFPLCSSWNRDRRTAFFYLLFIPVDHVLHYLEIIKAF